VDEPVNQLNDWQQMPSKQARIVEPKFVNRLLVQGCSGLAACSHMNFFAMMKQYRPFSLVLFLPFFDLLRRYLSRISQ